MTIRDTKSLIICKDNKPVFKVDEDVVLKIKVKNIPKILVKIYEVNLKKQCLEGLTEAPETMDLQSLSPTY